MVSLAFITVYWVVSKELGGGKYIQPSKQNFFISNRCQTSPFLTILVLFRLIRAFIVSVYPGYQLTYGFPRIHYSFSGTKRQKSTQNIVTQLNKAQYYEQFNLKNQRQVQSLNFIEQDERVRYTPKLCYQNHFVGSDVRCSLLPSPNLGCFETDHE